MEAFTPKMLAEDRLHIDANMTSSPMDVSHEGDVDMWDDSNSPHKMLSADDIATPTGVEPFFDQSAVFGTPSPIKRASYWSEEAVQRFHEATQLRQQQLQQQQHLQQQHLQQHQQGHAPRVEPSNEPCTEEIPWPELVYWLGNSSTGQVECTCATCQFERSQGRVPSGAAHHHHAHHPHHPHVVSAAAASDQYAAAPSSVYKRLSAKIPVIAVPRIEGVN